MRFSEGDILICSGSPNNVAYGQLVRYLSVEEATGRLLVTQCKKPHILWAISERNLWFESGRHVLTEMER